MARTFALYPEERHWWSFADYGHVLDTVRALGAKRILEFGPGSSTLALIEGGATHIDTCEDAEDWATVYEDRLQGKYPAIVHLRRYTLGEPLKIDGVGVDYDLALIDGPRGSNSRPPVIRYAMERCAAVLVPTEDRNRTFRAQLAEIAANAGWDIAITDTGPLSGGFALLTPKAHVEQREPDEPEEPATDDEATPAVLPSEVIHDQPPPLLTRPEQTLFKRRGRPRKVRP
jgi:hypothetical protein